MNRLPFTAKIELSPEEKEIRAWLKLNRNGALRDLTALEVAHYAVKYGGFQMTDVVIALSHFRDAMDGSHFNNRAALQGWLFECAVEDAGRIKSDMARVPELDLMPLWRELVQNAVTGEAI